MKKVGIITFHSSHNYGAMLQAYALQQKCLQMNTDCEIIDYRTPEMINNYAVLKKVTTIKQLIKNILLLPRYSVGKERYRRFEAFISDYLQLTARYSSLEDLKVSPPDADVYITGSDQVWNASVNLKDAYFLPFGDGKIKLSYAASMGDHAVKSEYESCIAEYLSTFKQISVREATSAEWLEKLIHRSIDVVCDPVFLLTKEQWKKICAPNVSSEEHYIFCYCLGEAGEMQEVIDAVKQELGVKTVTVCDDVKPSITCDEVHYDAGPIEFLSYLSNAEFVITNSFHGTAFSIIMEKPFYAVKRKQPSERIRNVLELFGLQNRYIGGKSEIMNEKIDFEHGREVQDNLRKQAESFLRRGLGV